MGLRRQADRQHYVISAVVFKCLTCSTFYNVTDDVILPLGGVGKFFLGESLSRIYPNYMCAKFGCGPTVVSKKGETDRQRDTAAL